MVTWLVIRWYGREESKRGQLFSCWSEKNHDDPASPCTATTNDTENVLRKNHTGHTHDQCKQCLGNNIGGRYQRIPIWRCLWEVMSAFRVFGCGGYMQALHAPPRKLSLDQIHMIPGV